ncbi:unnamed protein product [Cochlearia groenlandica]
MSVGGEETQRKTTAKPWPTSIDVTAEPESETEHRSARPLDIDQPGTQPLDLDIDQQGARAPIAEEHEGAITRSKAKELAKKVQAMMMEDDGAARSHFNVFSTAT